MPDWRRLLVLYMTHVMAEDGDTYLTSMRFRNPITRQPDYAEEDVAALEAIEMEIQETTL